MKHSLHTRILALVMAIAIVLSTGVLNSAGWLLASGGEQEETSVVETTESQPQQGDVVVQPVTVPSSDDGTFSDGGSGDFRELYTSLLDGASWHKPDNYYLLGDLESYVEAKLKCNSDYKDSDSFGRKMWLNMCNSGKFSSDRTIADYAENIWKIK